MAILTRSKDALRRGRSADVVKSSKKTSLNPKTLVKNQRLTLKSHPYLQPLIFTKNRKIKVKQFLAKAKMNPKPFVVGTKRWFKGLVNEIDEPGTVLFENVQIWFSRYPNLFTSPNKTKNSKRNSKQLKRLKSKKQEEKEKTWSTTAQASDDDKASFVDSPQSDATTLEDDVFEEEEVLQKSPKDNQQFVNFVVKDSSDLTVQISDAELMRELLGDFKEPVSPSKFGTDLTDVDPELLAEVLEELDRHFQGVDMATMVNMVEESDYYYSPLTNDDDSGDYSSSSTLTNDSGIFSSTTSPTFQEIVLFVY